ncbi:MAG TPA: TonB-dependent receptor [Polyangiaceae bacterium]|nr:TonB-dependent receptor [Polyangiaceae bacterium]
MRRSRPRALLLGALVGALVAGRSFAQEPAGPGEPGGSAQGAHVDRSPRPPPAPPALRTHAEATYPPEALRDRLEATVTLEVEIDEHGDVTGAKVLAPAGHGFDQAALDAVRRFTFTPAMQAGKPVASVVQLAYEFHLPARPPAPPAAGVSAPAPAPPPPSPQEGPVQTVLVLAQRPISAASSFAVQDREFQLRPIGSVQDILRVTPGLVMVQHSGGGKANQYFLRGFDADHGTDIALSVDGVPINMPSHAHGQGFADTNFIIPEAVERVEITKGPYFANQGDFATAGAVNLVTRDDFDHSSVGFGVSGSPGHGGPGYRGLLVASPKWDAATATFAAEVGRQDGPFDSPENWNKYKLFNKLTFHLSSASTLSIGEMSYGGTWHGSGQIPVRAVDEGLVTRFGSIDPSEGGDTTRHHVYAQYRLRPSEDSEIRALVYAGTYTFDLFSNFTLYLRDPANGDEIEQQDRRTFYGAKASYRLAHKIGGVRFETTLGADVRGDDIHEMLWHAVDRVPLDPVRDDGVHQTLIGAYVSEEIAPVEWARLVVGARADELAFSVDNNLPAGADPLNPRSGADGAQQISPKASAIVSALRREDAQLDLYLDWGNGFHSNDVRGAFVPPPSQPVTPLTRAIGEEIGLRTRAFDRLDFAAAYWLLDLDNETVWNGDDGTTAVSGATRRYGVELEARYAIFPWLAADGAVTFTHSQFSADRENGGGLALAPKQTWSGGLSVRHPIGPGVARAGLRFYGIGDRPASDDGVIVAPGFTQVDLHAGYRTRRWDVALDIENLLDGDLRSAQFDTISRLRNDPAVGTPVPVGFCGPGGRVANTPMGYAPSPRAAATVPFFGCEGVDFTPAYPLTARLMATLFLD